IAVRNFATRSSMCTVPRSEEYNPNFSIMGCNRERLKICSCIEARRWFVASDTTGFTSSGDTVGSSTKTRVWEVNRFGRNAVEPSASEIPPITVKGRIHQYLFRILFTSKIGRAHV